MLRRFPLLAALALSLAAASLPLLAGCGDTFVDPFLRNAGSFSVYGVLISQNQTVAQRVRVQVVRTLPDPPTEPEDPAVRFGGRVWSENLTTGDSLLWNERQVRLPDGTLGTLFERTFYPEPGTTYRLHVGRTGGGTDATTEVSIPAVPRATLGPVVVGSSRVTQEVSWSAARLVETTFYVRVSGLGGFQPVFVDVGVPEPGEPLVIDYTAIAADVRRQLDLPPTATPALSQVGHTVLGADETWPLPPEDLREMAQPGAYSNVENGYGFVGGATRGVEIWRPDAEAMRAAGFLPAY